MRFLFLLLVLPWAANALDTGECKAQPNSKKYLSDNFSDPYPKTVEFTCYYTCKSYEGIEDIKAKSSVLVSSMSDDGLKVVCEGVKVKRTNWGFEFDRVEPVYAKTSTLKELRMWAKENQIYSQKEIEIYTKVKKNLTQVINSFKPIGHGQFAYFLEAALILEEINNELPNSTNKLEFYVALLKDKTFPQNTAYALVKQQLKGNVYWLFE